VIIAVVLAVIAFIPAMGFMGVILSSYANGAFQRGMSSVTPDTFYDIAITVRKDGQEWRETVKIVCVSITDGIALQVFRTRTEFPEFTIMPLDSGNAAIVPIVSVCDRRMNLRQAVPMITDSATAPTWISSPADLRYTVELASTPSRSSAENERAVREHYRRLRDTTNWGSVMEGRTNVSDRFAGIEFERLLRTDFDNSIDDIPAGALDNHCVGYGPEGSEVSNFRACVQGVWHALPGGPPEAGGQSCQRFRIASQCTATHQDNCTPVERLYRRTVDEEYSERIGWPLQRPGIHGCYGVLETASGFSLLSLATPPLFVVLEPERPSRQGRITRYVED
jgi:hypothetical protein